MIEFRAGEETGRGILAVPRSGNGSGVLVLHAWWGLNDFFKQFCERLATEDFVVFAPDLYHGKTADTVEAAETLRDALDDDAARREVVAALRFLQDQTATEGDQVGVIGFSLGASYALWLAGERPDEVAAVVTFYGSGLLTPTKAAYLGHFAERDIYEESPEKATQLEQALRDSFRDVTYHIYPDTEHWFFEANRPEYDADAARIALQRTITFLQNHLTPAPES